MLSLVLFIACAAAQCVAPGLFTSCSACTSASCNWCASSLTASEGSGSCQSSAFASACSSSSPILFRYNTNSGANNNFCPLTGAQGQACAAYTSSGCSACATQTACEWVYTGSSSAGACVAWTGVSLASGTYSTLSACNCAGNSCASTAVGLASGIVAAIIVGAIVVCAIPIIVIVLCICGCAACGCAGQHKPGQTIIVANGSYPMQMQQAPMYMQYPQQPPPQQPVMY